VGLLTAPLSLARGPLRLTFRAWEIGLSSAAEVARIGTELLDPSRGGGPLDAAPVAPDAEVVVAEVVVAEPAVAEPAVAEPAVAEPDAPPAVPDELIPDHVDEEPVLVAEAAEEGAEEGAGAELRVDPPWNGYDQMTAADIRDRLATATAAEAATAELYEASGKNRRSVLEAAERALRG
jgi:hypothetical protein